MLDSWSDQGFQRGLLTAPKLLPVVLGRWVGSSKNQSSITGLSTPVSVPIWQNGQQRLFSTYQLRSGVFRLGSTISSGHCRSFRLEDPADITVGDDFRPRNSDTGTVIHISCDPSTPLSKKTSAVGSLIPRRQRLPFHTSRVDIDEWNSRVQQAVTKRPKAPPGACASHPYSNLKSQAPPPPSGYYHAADPTSCLPELRLTTISLQPLTSHSWICKRTPQPTNLFMLKRIWLRPCNLVDPDRMPYANPHGSNVAGRAGTRRAESTLEETHGDPPRARRSTGRQQCPPNWSLVKMDLLP